MKAGLENNSTRHLRPLDVLTEKCLRLRKIEQPTEAQRKTARADALRAARILNVPLTELAAALQ